MEVTIGMGVIGMTSIALFSGFTSGFFSMQLARENLRATQVMLEKTETLRLYTWDQVNSNGFIPRNFTNYYDPHSTNGQSGAAYVGTMTITNVPFNNGYSPDMRMVTVDVNWSTGSLPRTRTFTTYVSRNGLQTYIY